MRNNWHSIREYEALRAVITSGTTEGAGRLLGITQPTVSRAISQLETRMNTVLFERRGGRLRPTAEALRLNAHLDRLFDAIAIIDGSDLDDPGSQPLRLAAPPSLADLVATNLASFMKLHPRQRISLETCTSNGMVSRIADDSVDLGFTHADLSHSAMELIPFQESVAVCVMPRNHPLSIHDTITPELLDGVDFIAILRRHVVRSRLDRVFSEAGSAPNRVAEVATGLSAVTMARAGCGVSVICPFPVLKADDPTLTVRPFLPRFVYRTSFAVSTLRPLSRAARAFMRHVKISIRSDPAWQDVLGKFPDRPGGPAASG